MNSYAPSLTHFPTARGHIDTVLQLIRKTIYPKRAPLTSLTVAGPVDRIPYAAAQELSGFQPAQIGQRFGPNWATYWFRVEARVPKDFAGQRVEFIWNSNSEATLWMDGKVVQGLNTHNHGPRLNALLTTKAKADETFTFQVEMACNTKFGVNQNDGTAIAPSFQLDTAEIAVRDQLAWELYYDFLVLSELEREHERGLDPAWAGRLLSGLNAFASLYNPADRESWTKARENLKPLLETKNAQTTHNLYSIGHAHIDTAWLWPLAETWRKCERTFASACRYMDDYKSYKFACSQAYQYDIIQKRNPDLYKRMKERHARGQWIPVGGTWIEPDCNLPSGEALCRQFLFGQRYFEREFGARCREFWNPDVFGYNGQLPQIMAQAGIKRFLTQKLSWNSFTKPLHHTFDWEGIDGTRVLSHFPPSDTYNSNCSVKEVRYNVSNFKDHATSGQSFYLFGWGDGGGGPTQEMLERVERMGDLQGMPRMKMTDSDTFFDSLEKENANRPVVVGELYFELHRGTYTSQSRTKRGNRKCEQLLHDIEFLASAAQLKHNKAYPRKEINALWEVVLLNQFHDILPGSSITLVYDDTHRDHAQVLADGAVIKSSVIAQLSEKASETFALNTTPVAQVGVVNDGAKLAFAKAEAYSTAALIDSTDTVKLDESAKQFVLENAALRATIDRSGRVTSLIEKSTGRESLTAPGNVLKLFHDRPHNWEAWDVDITYLETLLNEPAAHTASVSVSDRLRGEIRFDFKLSEKSTLTQRVRLDAQSKRLEFFTTVDWHEDGKFLRVAFPVNARAMDATYEMQFGHVQRPTHFNTLADRAQFEVPFHKWFDLSEHGFGVSILSDCKYGASTLGNVMSVSLMRATKSPDPQADMGTHEFAYAIYPHAGRWDDADTVAQGYSFNQPMQAAKGLSPVAPIAQVGDRNLVLDTIKFAEDNDDVILRFYECHGARGVATLKLGFDAKSAAISNTLEELLSPLLLQANTLQLRYRPHQILTIRVGL